MPKNSNTSDTVADLASVVTDAIGRDRRIKELKEQAKTIQLELDVLEGQLLAAALKSEEGWEVGSGESMSFVTRGRDGDICRIINPGQKLMPSIQPGALLEKLEKLAGPEFTKLFDSSVTFKPQKDFRTRCNLLLGDKVGQKVITLLLVDSAPRFTYETAKTT